jgi:tricorn protease
VVISICRLACESADRRSIRSDKAANRYRIAKILAGQNEEDIYRSPFTEVGSEAKVGDYVIAIDGEDVTADRDIYSYLRGKADRHDHVYAEQHAGFAGRTHRYDPTDHKRVRSRLS